MSHRKLLILDLDETLIHASPVPLARPADFCAGPWHVYRRPGLDEFLALCTAHFDLAIWTSSSALYATAIIDMMVPPALQWQFVWSRERCTRRFDAETWEYEWLKDLKKVKKRGYDLAHVLMVDDTPEKLARHYGNLIRVEPFTGNENDDELPRLGCYLQRLVAVDNVRQLEKRFWRDRDGWPKSCATSSVKVRSGR